jgi:heme o synthase
MMSLISTTHRLRAQYWPLIKSRQTFLLTLTGIAGYLCQPPSSINWFRLFGLAGSLLVTISGCTVLNMLFDRDIDRKMVRTSQRPLASGQMNLRTISYLGMGLIIIGLLWSLVISRLFFVVILVGAGANVLVYTLWLKRRSAWSIFWGGIAGGMPILAGRVLAIGQIDTFGLFLALIIICWIPSHNLTLSTLYAADYLNAGMPTFLSVYGIAFTCFSITLSSLLTAIMMVAVCSWLILPPLIFIFLFIASITLVGLAIFAWVKPTQNLIRILYKYSSLYMLVSMLLLSLNRLL